MKRTTLYATAAAVLVVALVAAAAVLPGYAAPSEKGLGEEEAKAIALREADVTETQVTQLKVRQDRDQGVDVYDVEFNYDGQEYDYEINAETGAILEQKIEPDDDANTTTKNNTNTATTSNNATTNNTNNDTTTNNTNNTKDTTNTTDTNTNTTNGKTATNNTATLTREEALAIALKDAGVAEGDIYQLETDLDWEDDYGVQVYEIEFDCNGQEYQYEINAETGDILKRGLDTDGKGTTTTTGDTLTQEEAVAIACKDAGVAQDQVSHLRVEQDWDDGVMTYNIEFYNGNTEYDYEIHGTTGQILEQDQENHH